MLLRPCLLLPLTAVLYPASSIETSAGEPTVSIEQFIELEELSRIVDISYCVGVTSAGIQKPFECASRCADFNDFELIKTWNTGQLLSDSCGYIALSHSSSPPRILLAFRGTYSIANTIADLSTIPQEYEPYPGGDGDKENTKLRHLSPRDVDPKKAECTNCTVHMGFMRSWTHTKPHVMPDVEDLLKTYPGYRVTLVGHSLGGAVATLASLDFHARGWEPKVVTFGAPRIGNGGMAEYVDKTFQTSSDEMEMMRVTHVDDPVPLLPLTEWGFRAHAGEIYISKSDLPPEAQDLQICEGQADPTCLAGAETTTADLKSMSLEQAPDLEGFKDSTKGSLTIPARWRIWQLFFAHRDYFWRLGLCVPWLGERVFDAQLPIHDDKGSLEL